MNFSLDDLEGGVALLSEDVSSFLSALGARILDTIWRRFTGSCEFALLAPDEGGDSLASLYPGQSRLALAHCLQVGLVSSHYRNN